MRTPPTVATDVDVESGHTPTPWHATATVHADRRNIFGPGHHVGTLLSGSLRKLDRFEADTRFIIHAVNSHDALVEALREAAIWFEGDAAGHYSRAMTAPSAGEQHGHEVRGKASTTRAKALRNVIAKAVVS